ncbi:MAG: YhdT family protein [Mogibacterium sp.]|nr:YhdT family protein [Mogibacterium sp.]
MKKIEKMTREEKDRQVRREAGATLILFAICFFWNVFFAYTLSGLEIRIGGLPLWWLISVPGMFVIAVIGVVYLLKKVFVNFELEDDEAIECGGMGTAESMATAETGGDGDGR